MNRPGVPVSPDILRSRLIRPAAIAYSLSALAGLVSVVLLFVPGAARAMLEDMVLSGITNRSALGTWQFIHTCVTAVVFLWSAMMSLYLLGMLTGRAGKGLNLVYHAAHLGLRAVNISGICALVLLIYRLARFLILNFNLYDWLYQVYAMAISEALMVAQAWFLFTLLRRFLDSLCDAAASMGYTLAAGKLDRPTIPSFTANGFLVLGIAGLLMFFDRFFTVTIVRDYMQDYYALLTAEHPLLQFTAGAFLFGGIGSIFVSIYLRRYKRRCEWLLFESAKR